MDEAEGLCLNTKETEQEAESGEGKILNSKFLEYNVILYDWI